MIGILKSKLSISGVQKAYALLAPYIGKQRKAYTGLLVLVLIDIMLTLAFAWFLGQITDAAVQQQFERLYWLVPFGILLSILTIVAEFVTNRLEFSASNGVKVELSERLLRHIMLLPVSRTDQLHSGELMTHFNQDIHNINGMIGSRLMQCIQLPLIFLAVVIYMFHIHWVMALMGLLILPIAVGAGGLLGFVLRRKTRTINDTYGNLNKLLTETLQGLSVIRSFSVEATWFRKFTDKNRELYKLQEKYMILQGWIRGGSQAAGSFIFLVSFCLGAYFVTKQVITIGSLLAFVNLSGHLLYPLTGLAGVWIGIQEASTAVDRIATVLREPIVSTELPATVVIPGKKSIEFRDVSFSYDGQTPVIERFNLTVLPGQTVAIVGASGAGKSTLFHLLQGFYKPQVGSIFMDGVSIHELAPSHLRSSIALVAQETFLFSSSIRDNLRLARPDASQQRIEQAAMHANIHDYIMTLPNCYDTEIGERGVTLSGGQKQRIAIARAILRDAPILLLDEATSALDSETEFQVKRSLDRLMAERTTIIIAHRLSTIQHADLIIVLEQGMIVQTGKHEDLVARPGAYRNLKHLQHMQERRGHG
ncbi:MAG: ABC transporter ATP-binding protein/permease [Gorillibacterium sp.]|nr:ABC transporter ATP-binding protein/permease [Gorillibacterium sp.]